MGIVVAILMWARCFGRQRRLNLQVEALTCQEQRMDPDPFRVGIALVNQEHTLASLESH